LSSDSESEDDIDDPKDEEKDVPATLESPHRTRLWSRAAEELLATEKIYVGKLHVLVDIFMAPLLKRANSESNASTEKSDTGGNSGGSNGSPAPRPPLLDKADIKKIFK